MFELRYALAKMKCKLLANKKEVISDYFRKLGMKVGKGCNICCNIMTMEPFLIEIGNDVTISGDVKFVTHDNSVAKLDVGGANVFGRIVIGNNCFIGQSSIIMYGVKLANNVIVASGSVVCNSFSESNIIIGGNPAKKIGTWDEFRRKMTPYAMSRSMAKKLNSEKDYTKFIVRRNK